MGLDSRDYARDRYANERRGSGGGGFRSWEVWKKLIAVNVVVFLLQVFFTRPVTIEDVRQSPYYMPEYYGETITDDELATNDSVSQYDTESADGAPHSRDSIPPEALEEIRRFMPQVSIVQKWFELDSEKVAKGQIWRLVTSGFCHDRHSIWHLLFNMLFLFWFGSRLERRYGSAEFTALYFASLLSASFAYIALDIYTGTMIPAIGASGAVWGVLACYALLYPYEKIYVYFLFPVEIRFLAIIYFIFDLHPVLLAISGDPQYSGIAHAAHVGGAVFGFLYWKFDWRLMPLIRKLGGRVSDAVPQRPPGHRSDRERPMILKMPEPDFRPQRSDREEQQLDSILAKLSREGRAALTDEELDVLEQTSRQIRDQRRQGSTDQGSEE